jgi:hypothetical protein
LLPGTTGFGGVTVGGVRISTSTGIAGLTAPFIGSVAVTVSGFSPSGSQVSGIIDQFPDPSTIPVPITSPLALRTVIISPGVPVPTNVGVVSVVTTVPVFGEPSTVVTVNQGTVIVIVPVSVVQSVVPLTHEITSTGIVPVPSGVVTSHNHVPLAVHVCGFGLQITPERVTIDPD